MYSSKRCVELAEAAHLTYTARLICSGTNREIFEVPSRDRSTTHTVVRILHDKLEENTPEGSMYCDCKARENCCHIGASIILVDQRAACYAA